MVINKSQALTLLFATCVVTRIASSIYYIEDADSLRFALGILDYDVVKYQPHFPGYPVYCFLVKIYLYNKIIIYLNCFSFQFIFRQKTPVRIVL